MTRIVTLMILGIASPALAQPASAESAVLFKEAQALMVQGRYAEACDAFDASQRLDPTPNTALNQANCREKNNQLATAWGEFIVVERSTRTAADEDGKRTHRVASEHAAKLEARLSTLTVRVPDDVRVGGLEILRGSEPVDSALWGKAIPIDGGTYKIVARAPGNAEWTTTITIGNERDAQSLDIPRLTAAALHTDAPAPPVEPRVESRIAPPIEAKAVAHAEPRAHRSYLPLLVGGAALASLGGGLALEMTARSTFDGVATAGDHEAQLDRWRTANHQRYAAEGFAAAGGIAAGVAVYLYIRDRRSERRAVIAPAIAGDHLGVQLVGGF